MEDRVVITGLGTVNPLGLTVDETWENIKNGVSGVGEITCFDPSSVHVKLACEVKGFNPENYLPAKEARRRDRVELLATAAASQAIHQSGILDSNIDPDLIGVIISSAVGGLHTLHQAFKTIVEKGTNRVSAFTIPMMMTNGSAGMVSIDYGFHGPCFSVASACASGSDAIGMAMRLLREGIIDVAIAGGSESTVLEVAIATFDRVGALTRRDSADSSAPQPFDLNRDGLVMGEGSGIIVMERERFAKSRGAQILAEVAGHASSSDASHITAPHEKGGGGALAIRNALKDASINPEDIDYINAHGTGTILNDASETKAIKASLGKIAYNIPVSSTKSMTGHMMGATGALETIFCVKTIQDQIIPPTINYQTPDPECDLDYVPNISRESAVEVTVNNAFGFGGHNAVLVIRKF